MAAALASLLPALIHRRPGLARWCGLVALVLALCCPAGSLAAATIQPVLSSSGSGLGGPSDLTTLGGILYFGATDGTHGVEPWRSDGTQAGTYMLVDANPGFSSSSPGSFALSVLGSLFFTASDSTHGQQLWIVSQPGYPPGIQNFAHIVPSTATSGSGNYLSNLVAFGAGVYYLSTTASGAANLMYADGATNNGDAVSIASFTISGSYFGPSYAPLISLAGNRLYFFASDGTHGLEPWSSSGNSAGTAQLADIIPGAGSSLPYGFVALNGSTYFEAMNSAVAGLYQTNGTTAGTVLVQNTAGFSGGNGFNSMAEVNGQMFFAQTTPGSGLGTELWRSDGTTSGTFRLAYIAPAGVGMALTGFQAFNNQMFFNAGFPPQNEYSLWYSDGTAAGTAALLTSSTLISNAVPYGGRLLYGTGGGTQLQIFSSDGTAGGTQLVATMASGVGVSIQSLYVYGSNLYISTVIPPSITPNNLLMLSMAPTVQAAAAANPNPATGTTIQLSALGAAAAGESTLTYTWSVLSGATATVSGILPNGSNAAKLATATFTSAGTATFLVSIADSNGFAVTSQVTVTVDNVAPTIAIATPANGQLFASPAAISLTANGSGSDGISQVSYYLNNSTLIGTATASPYQVPWTGVPAGAYSLTAVATGGLGAPTTSAPVTITVDDPVSITTQPVGLTVNAGTAATFSVAAGGTAPLTYQWSRSNNFSSTWTPIAGATSATYTTGATALSDNDASFEVTVSNAVSAATSAAAVLVVDAIAPKITTQPASLSVVAGSPASFAVAVAGTAPFTYQWNRSNDGGATWNQIAGATAPSYALQTTALSDNAEQFKVIVSNGGGAATSLAATLTIGLLITSQPGSQSLYVGAATNFAVVAGGTAPFTYQWSASTDGGTAWSPIAGATAAAYSPGTAQLALSGYEYRAVVSNSVGSLTSAAALLTVTAQPVSITAQPASATVNAGAAASFSVVASGTPPIAYQWSRSNDGGSTWAAISGATAATYGIAATSMGDNDAEFRVAVSNSVNSVTSAVVNLTVHAIPVTITTQPSNATVNAGTAASFSVVAVGTAPIAYQWSRSSDGGTTWSAISGATGAAYTTATTAMSDNAAKFRVAASNSANSVTSAAATLTVDAVLVAITTQPANTTVNAGSAASFSVAVSGTAPFTYQWSRSNDSGTTWTAISGATAASYSIAATAMSDNSAKFRVAVANGAGSVTSSAATLTVDAVAVAIITQPASATVNSGATAAFSVAASGTAPIAYQWSRSNDGGTTWTAISGATAASYSIAATAMSDTAAKFRVAVNNSVNSVTSAVATLTVDAVKVAITTQPANATVNAGSAASFSVAVSGTAPFTYQWSRSNDGGTTWTAISGATAVSYSIAATAMGDNASKFRVAVANSAGSATSSAATLTVDAVAVAITTQPASATVKAGAAAAFSVAASGTAPIAFQWSRSNDGGTTWTAISAATAASYSIAATAMSDTAAKFRVAVSNSVNAVTSVVATLTVDAVKVAITTQPASTNVVAGNPATFKVVVSGTAPITYQWSTSTNSGSTWTAISGATAATYTIAAAALGSSGAEFRVVAANTPGSVTSTAAILTVTPATAPSFTTQPAAKTVNAGSAATFTVVASGSAPLTYQWSKSINAGSTWTAISGATAATYTTPATAMADNASEFRVVVGNAAGTATSAAAVLTVDAVKVAISNQPASASVTAGSQATFRVVVSGTAPFTYQWSTSANSGSTWTAISGATAATYTTPATVLSQSGSEYRVAVANAPGSVTSSAATLTVTPVIAPSITTQPAAKTVNAGSAASFTVVASGTAPLSYQWSKSVNAGSTWTAISGATAATYSTPATAMADNGSEFRVVVSNSAGTATSAAATLTVDAIQVTIATQPASETVNAGSTASFSVVAAGTAPITYQWSRSNDDGTTWTAVSGATAASYSIAAAALSDNAAKFKVAVANSVNTATSSAATLTVDAVKVAITTQPASKTVNAGAAAGFSVVTTGTAPITYQWSRSSNAGSTWTAISGATTASYTLAATAMSDNAAEFRVAVTNSVGTVTSTVAILTVVPVAVSITAQPANATVIVGASAGFTVVAAGTAPITYQWSRSNDGGTTWTAITGATSTAYATAATALSDTGAKFHVAATNSASTVTSAAATLTVNGIGVSITTQPAASIVTVGTAANFSVIAAGTAPITYQWSRSNDGGTTWTAIAGATTAAYTTAATVAGDNAAEFHVLAANGWGSAISQAAVLTVVNLPSIAFQSASQSVSEAAGQVLLPVTLSQPWSQDVTVSYAVTGGTATGGGVNYLIAPGTVTIPATTTRAAIAVQLRDDGVIQPNRTVVVTLSAPTNAQLGATTATTLTIIDADTPTLQLAASQPNAVAGGADGAFTITRTGSLATALTVNLTTSGNALAGTDYTTLASTIAIPAGSGVVTVPVLPIVTTLQKPPANITLTLATGTGYAIGAPSAATVTIANGNTVSIAATVATASYGTTAVPGTFTVSRLGSTAAALTVNLSFGGTAPTSAYTASPSATSVTIPANAATATVAITPASSTTATPPRSIMASIAPGNYTLSTTNSATITLVDAALPTVTIAAAAPTLDKAAATAGSFTVSRTPITSAAVTVSYAMSGTAANGIDYAIVSGSVVISASQASATIAITPLPNPVSIPAATVTATLLPTSAYSAGTPAAATISIMSSTVSIAATHATAAEPGGETGIFTITRSAPLDAPLKVGLALAGTALPNVDYTSSPASLASVTFAAGASTVPINVTALPDTLVEGTEYVVLGIAPSWQYALGGQATATIAIADATLSAAASPATIDNQSGVPAVFTITRSGNLSQAVSVPFNMQGTAAVSAYTLAPAGSTIAFAAGSATATVTLTPVVPATPIGTQTAILVLGSAPSYGQLAPSATVTISDDILPSVTIVATQPTCSEASTAPGMFSIVRSVGSASPLTISLSLSGSAVLGSNFTSIPASPLAVTIPANVSGATVQINPLDDHIAKLPGSVNLSINPGALYNVGYPAQASVVIADADTPLLSIAATVPSASSGGASGELTITRLGSVANDLAATLTWTGTAVNGSDYTAIPTAITLPAGLNAIAIPVVPAANLTFTGTRTAVATIVAGSGYTVGSPATATVAIAQNTQTLVSIIATQQNAAEGPTAVPGVFTISRAGSTTAALTVGVALAGTAPGSRYSSTPSATAVTIAAGAAAATLTITPVNDSIAEGAQTVIATLQPGPYTIDGNAASDTVTIADDDLPTVTIAATQPTAIKPSTAGTFTVTRSAIAATALTVPYTIGGSAVPGIDFVPLSGSVVIPASAATATIALTPRETVVPHAPLTAVLTLTAGSGYTLGSPGIGAVTIIGDALPAPHVSSVAASPTSIQLRGAAPVAIGVTSLAVTVLSPASHGAVSGTVDPSGFFTASVANGSPASAMATISLAYGDAYGHTGPSTIQSVAFSTAGSIQGGGGSGGGAPAASPAQPPASPNVNLAITAGLTGDKSATVDGQTLYFTNGISLTVQVNASTSAGTITAMHVYTSDGQSIDATSGTANVSTYNQGHLTITATATASLNGIDIVGSAPTTLSVISDRGVPSATWRLPQRYWPAGTNSNTQPDAMPLIPHPALATFPADYWKDRILLNGMSDTANATLRQQYGSAIYNRDGFTLEGSVTSLSGLSTVTAPTVLFVNAPGTATVATDASGHQVITINGFAALPDAADPGDPNGGGRVTIYDRCGNSGSVGWGNISSNTTPPGTAVFSYPGYLLGFYFNDLDNGLESFTTDANGVAQSPFTPVRFITTNSHTIVDAWQDVQDDAHLMTKLYQTGTEPAEITSGYTAEFLLKTELTIAVGQTASATIIMRDAWGNVGQTQPLKVTRQQQEIPGAAYLDAPPPEIQGVPYSVTANHLVEFSLGQAYYNQVSQSAPVCRDSGNTSDTITFGLPQLLDGVPSDSGPGNLVFASTTGISDQFLHWTETHTYDGNQTTHATGTSSNLVDMVTPNLPSPTTYSIFNSGGYDQIDNSGSPLHINTPDVGNADQNRRALPIITTIPATWNAANAKNITMRIRDDGLQPSTDVTVLMDCARNSGREYSSVGAEFFWGFDGATATGNGGFSGSFLTVDMTSEGPVFPVPGLSLTAYIGNGNNYNYWSGIGYRWFNLIRVRPDLIAADALTTIRISAGFLAAGQTPQSINPNGDYVRFVGTGGDVTIPFNPSNAASSAGANQSAKIAIVGQRFVAASTDAQLVQDLELDLQVGAAVTAGTYDVDVTLGEVKAYSDSLSSANAGPHGSHRMLNALRVIKLEWVAPSNPGDSNSAPIAVTQLQPGRPSPLIACNPLSTLSCSDEGVELRITGTITDPIANQEPANPVSMGGAAIENITISSGSWSSSVPITSGSGTGSGFWQPYSWQGRFDSGVITLPAQVGTQIITLTSSVNAAQTTGSATVAINVNRESIPGAAASDVASPGLISASMLWPDDTGTSISFWFGTAAKPASQTATLTPAAPANGQVVYSGTLSGATLSLTLPAKTVLTPQVDAIYGILAVAMPSGSQATFAGVFRETGATTRQFLAAFPIASNAPSSAPGGTPGTWTCSAGPVTISAQEQWHPLACRVQGVDDPNAVIVPGNLQYGFFDADGNGYALVAQGGYRYLSALGKPNIFGIIQLGDGTGSMGIRMLGTSGTYGATDFLPPHLGLVATLQAYGQVVSKQAIEDGWEEIRLNPDAPVIENRTVTRFAHLSRLSPIVHITDGPTQLNQCGTSLHIVGTVSDPLDVASGRSDTMIVVDGQPVTAQLIGAAPKDPTQSDTRLRQFTADVPLIHDTHAVTVTAWNAVGGYASDSILVTGSALIHPPGMASVPILNRYTFGPAPYFMPLCDQSKYRVRLESHAADGTVTDSVQVALTVAFGCVRTSPVAVSRFVPGDVPGAVMQAVHPSGSQQQGTLLRIAGLDDDIWVVIERVNRSAAQTPQDWRPSSNWQDLDSSGTGWKLLIQQAGAELVTPAPYSLVWFNQPPVQGSAADLQTSQALSVRIRNLAQGPLNTQQDALVTGNSNSLPTLLSIPAPSADTDSNNQPISQPSTTLTTAPLTLSVGLNHFVAQTVIDRAGGSALPLLASLSAANQAFAIPYGDNTDARSTAGLTIAGPNSLIPAGTVLLVEMQPSVATTGQLALNAFLQKFEFEVVATSYTADDLDASKPGYLKMWIRARRDSGIMWGAMISSAEGQAVMIANTNALAGSEFDLRTKLASAAFDYENKFPSLRTPTGARADISAWLTARAAARDASAQEYIHGQETAAATVYDAGGQGAVINVLDCRYSSAGLQAVYKPFWSSDLQLTRAPFTSAQGQIATATRSASGGYALRQFSYVKRDHCRDLSDIFDGPSNNPNSMPRIFLQQTAAPSIQSLITQKGANLDGIILVIEGFNNGDGADNDEYQSLIRIDQENEDHPQRLLTRYWPKVQQTLSDNGLDLSKKLILDVWWSGSFSNNLRIGFVITTAPTGAYFNYDFATAHQTGRTVLIQVLQDIAAAIPDTQTIPVTILAESCGGRVAVSACEALKENPALEAMYLPRDPSNSTPGQGKVPLRVILAHPALRQRDIATAWENQPVEELETPPLIHPYSESPLLSELNVMAGGTASACKVLMFNSTFDKAGLAFAAGQRNNPHAAIDPSQPALLQTTMLGRRGLSTGAGDTAYDRQSSLVQIADYFIGAVDSEAANPKQIDYWHVDLFGWNLPNEPFHSRHRFDSNIPGNGAQIFESQFPGGMIRSGLEVQGMIETVSANQLAIDSAFIQRAWKHIVTMIQTGVETQPNASPQNAAPQP
jgi:ELWxxDGT repeat protein